MENTFQNLSDLVFLWDFFLRKGSRKERTSARGYKDSFKGMYLIGKNKGGERQGYIENTIRKSKLYEISIKRFHNGKLDEIIKRISKEFNYSDDLPPCIFDANETIFKNIYTECFVYIDVIVEKMKKITKRRDNIRQSDLNKALHLKDIFPESNDWITYTLGILTHEQKVVLKNSIGNKACFSIGTAESIIPPIFTHPPINSRRSGMEQQGFEICVRLNLNFQEQIKIGAKNVRNLTCDLLIFVNGYSLYVEFNGKQHYERIPYFHKTPKDFENQLKRDIIKNAFFDKECAKDAKNIFLIISYQDNLEKILTSKIMELQTL